MSRIYLARDLPRHPLHYFTLLLFLGFGLFGLLWFNYERVMQLSILVTMAASYVVWGTIHHQKHRDLHVKIVFEYFVIAALAILILGSLILRA